MDIDNELDWMDLPFFRLTVPFNPAAKCSLERCLGAFNEMPGEPGGGGGKIKGIVHGFILLLLSLFCNE